ncbi:MAG: hypothetical protein EBR30_05190 [Cytophagia bacterium]|nr:hypothetical protein [Cytophagia bacterium]NBW34407.1 hypothetical protein [Cytophagia bacterium]
MENLHKTYHDKSGQLELSVFLKPDYLIVSYKDLSSILPEDYLEFNTQVGNEMFENKIGRLLLDISKMQGFGLSLRAAGVNNLDRLMIQRAPFFVLAIIKGPNLFENLATQTALKMALPLSKKFLAGEMFDSNEVGRKKALDWLLGFPVPSEFK